MKFQTKAALLLFFMLLAFGIMGMHLAAMNKLDKNGKRTIASVEIEKTETETETEAVAETETVSKNVTETVSKNVTETVSENVTETKETKEEVASCIDCENKEQDKYEAALAKLTNLLIKILNLQQSFNDMLYANTMAPATTVSPESPSSPMINWYDQYMMPDNSHNYWNSPYNGGYGYRNPNMYNNYYNYNNHINRSYAENFQTERHESIDARELDYSLFESNQPAIGFNFAYSPRYSIDSQSAGFIELR